MKAGDANSPVIEFLVVLFTKENIISDGLWKNNRLLLNIGDRSIDDKFSWVQR